MTYPPAPLLLENHLPSAALPPYTSRPHGVRAARAQRGGAIPVHYTGLKIERSPFTQAPPPPLSMTANGRPFANLRPVRNSSSRSLLPTPSSLSLYLSLDPTCNACRGANLKVHQCLCRGRKIEEGAKSEM